MTSKIYSAVLAGTAVLAMTLGSTAAQAATEQATAQARVLRALTLENNDRPLDFGALVVTGSAFTVTISPAGARSACATCSGTFSAAQFDLGGTGGEFVNINADATVTLASGTNSMSATLLESATTVQLDQTTGAATFSVGGTLSVGAAQPEGEYEGQFNVTANYQ